MSSSSFSQMPHSPLDEKIEELETQRTIGLTRMHPADSGDQALQDQSSPVQDVQRTTYDMTISSMTNGLDGGVGTIEGKVEITEYVNDTYVSEVVVTTSVLVEGDTSLSLIEDRILNSTKDAIDRLAALSHDELRTSLENTKREQDQVYEQRG